MPIFYFHTQWNGHEADVGEVELQSLEAAKTEAIRFLGEILANQTTRFIDQGQCRVRVAEPTGQTVMVVEARSSSP